MTLCETLANFANINVTSQNRTVDSVVEMACTNNSLRFLDGKQHKQVTCTREGVWSEIVSNCTGKVDLTRGCYMALLYLHVEPWHEPTLNMRFAQNSLLLNNI